jgi:hypothetical protein
MKIHFILLTLTVLNQQLFAETFDFKKLDIVDFADESGATISPPNAFERSKDHLRMGGLFKTPPTLNLPIGKKAKGVHFEMGTTTSYSATNFIFMRDNKECFTFRIHTPQQMECATEPPQKWGSKKNPSFDLAIIGTKAKAENQLSLTFTWGKTDTGLQFNVSAIQKQLNEKVLVDLKNAKGKLDQVPNQLKIVNLRHDYKSRFIIFKSIEILN